ncbi:hemolysin-type calcium-binding protein [Citreicella sp. 357]|nr:hemolysin-type calcium-binding protein [Citreicella sp. 357]
MPAINISSGTALESEYVTFTVTLSEALTDEATVRWRTLVTGTANDDDLYYAPSSTTNNGTITFSPGETSTSINVYARGDNEDERDENFVVELFNPSANIELAGGANTLSATGVILDEDGTGSDLDLFVSDPVIVEGDGGSRNAVFEVRLSEIPSTALTVNYSTKDGSAVAGQDYQARSGSITFTGQTVALVSVPIIGDTIPEFSEAFDLVITSTSGAQIGTAGRAGTATILDDDSGTGPVISIGDGAALEGDSVRFVVSLSEPATDAVTVNYRTLMNGTANDDDLYYAPTGTTNNDTLTFAPGETTASIYIYARNDSTDERDENFTVELFGESSNAALAGDAAVLRATGIISDDDGTGSNLDLFVSDPVLVEGDSGSKIALFQINLSQPASSALTVSYTTANGTGTAGQDYGAQSGTLTFAPGQKTASVAVPVFGDTSSEPSETFSLVVTPPSGVSLGTGALVGTATILDDDSGPGPVISIADGAALEGESLRFVVTLSEPATDAVTVNYRTLMNGTANDDDLYYAPTSTSNNGIVTFAAGETTASIYIYARNDSADERDENFTVELFDESSNAALAGNAATLRANGIISDDDGTGSNLDLFVSDPVLIEGDSGRQLALFQIDLSQPAARAMTVGYSTQNGSATAGQDYQAQSGIVTFAAGQSSASIAVPVFGDRLSEPTETFSLVVTPPSGVSLGSRGLVGSATILDDDSGPGPVISIADAAALEGEYLRFVVTLSEPATDAITVNYRTLLSGSADDDDLYYASSGSHNNGTVTFAAGQTTASIYIYPRSDSTDERDENFAVELYDQSSNASLAGRVSILRANGIILDDDGAGSNTMLLASPDPVIEGYDGTFLRAYDVQLSQPLTSAETFDVSATGFTATLGADVTLVTDTITFVAGQTSATVLVRTRSDNLVEGTETFQLNFTARSGTHVNGTIPSVTVSIDDGAGYGGTPSSVGDRLVGTMGADTIHALAGNDTVFGWLGSDTLYGDTGRDRLWGGVGNDRLWGGSDGDLLVGETGADLLRGEAGQDTLRGGSSNDTLFGGDDDDLLFGEAGSDVLWGEAGDDTLQGGGGNDSMHGGTGGDQLSGGSARDRIWGDNGDDTIWGGDGRDRSFLGGGDDVYYDTAQNTSDGADTVWGGAGNDTVSTGGGADVVHGELGDDSLNGGIGNDALFGEAGADTLIGGAGADLLEGGSHADLLIAGGWNDTVRGGDGADTARLGMGYDLYTDTGQGGRFGQDTVRGEGGNDTINGGGGDDLLFGQAGRDSLVGANGNDVLRGGEDRDTLIGGSGADTLYGEAGNDRVNGGNGTDLAVLGAGNDLYLDTAQSGAFGADTVWGGAGNDTLNGGGGDDSLNGGDGDDRLVGVAGDDTLNGGGGADVFVFARGSGADIIDDFVLADDRLELRMDASDLTALDQADGVLLSWTNGSVLIEGLSLSELESATIGFL